MRTDGDFLFCAKMFSEYEELSKYSHIVLDNDFLDRQFRE